jgi:integrase
MARQKTTTHFRVSEFKNSTGSQSYRVSGHLPQGKRVRQNFATRLEAEQRRADLEAEAAGMPATVQIKRTRLTDDQLADAEAAIEAAGSRRLSVIVSHYRSIEDRLDSRGLDIDSAVSFAESHYRSEISSVSILNAKQEFIDSKTGKTPRTISFYETSLRLLLSPDPNKNLQHFTVSDLEKILNSYKNVNTKRAYKTAFSAFFSWAVRHHYCLEDPCQRLDRLPKDRTQIAVLSLVEVKRLLHAAMCFQDGVAAADIAIGLFAGLRPSEINDLPQEDITKRGIRVSGGKLRRTLKRTVPIPKVLDEWLKQYPFGGRPQGWDYKLKKLKKATAAERWVQDIIRHTSISFQVERDKNEALTAFHNGTSSEMIHSHYWNTVDDEDTIEEYWNLTPAKIRKEKLEVDLPAVQGINWPSKAKLKKLVWQQPLVHAAAEIGVSDVAVKKRCVKLDIELPPRGYWLR